MGVRGVVTPGGGWGFKRGQGVEPPAPFCGPERSRQAVKCCPQLPVHALPAERRAAGAARVSAEREPRRAEGGRGEAPLPPRSGGAAEGPEPGLLRSGPSGPGAIPSGSEVLRKRSWPGGCSNADGAFHRTERSIGPPLQRQAPARPGPCRAPPQDEYAGPRGTVLRGGSAGVSGTWHQ